jgi:hypothetical protein
MHGTMVLLRLWWVLFSPCGAKKEPTKSQNPYRFLTQGKHLADNLREDGLCKVSLTTTQKAKIRVLA